MSLTNSHAEHRASITKIISECDAGQRNESFKIRLKSCEKYWMAKRQSPTKSTNNPQQDIYLTKYKSNRNSNKRKEVFNLQYVVPTQGIDFKRLQSVRQITEKKHSGKLSPDKAKKYNFPDFFNKFINKHLPVNASNPQLTNTVISKRAPELDSYKSYEQIRQEREKLEEMRKIVILGKILHENYKKDTKKLITRRNQFRKHTE